MRKVIARNANVVDTGQKYEMDIIITGTHESEIQLGRFCVKWTYLY
jgi:hypothetical protein